MVFGADRHLVQVCEKDTGIQDFEFLQLLLVKFFWEFASNGLSRPRACIHLLCVFLFLKKCHTCDATNSII